MEVKGFSPGTKFLKGRSEIETQTLSFTLKVSSPGKLNKI